MKIGHFFLCSHRLQCLGAARVVVFLLVAIILLPLNAGAQKSALPKLTLTQVEDLVSHHVPDSTMRTEIQRRGLAFVPNPAIVESLRSKGAGPLTLETIEALFPNATQSTQPAKTSATMDLDRVLVPILERSWNFYVREKIFLGPTYFGNTTSFGRHHGTLHSLALISDYPAYRALALKGLITLSELSLTDAPSSVFSGGGPPVKLERAATVSLTEAGARFGDLDKEANAVTFVLGTYQVEKITSNTAVTTSMGNYRLVEGSYVLNIVPEFNDVWGELGWPKYRDRKFRVLFKYDSARSQWDVPAASNGRFSAEDTGPRGGNFESENVPPTVDQLRMTHR
jgi:hypothetical protein